MLNVQNLSVRYDGRLALDDISFELPGGHMLGVIGPNGAGKTTLIRAISGVVLPAGGTLSVDGQNLATLSSQQRAQKMAVVPQARNLPPAFTAWETVLLGRTPYLNWLGTLSEQDEVICRRAMERTSTLELAERNTGELSGGEQQRLLLARALAQQTSLLLLDEPTTHLDLHYQYSLMEQVQGLVRQDGMTVLVALHDLNLAARYCDLLMLLVAGKICIFGTPDEVLKADILSPAFGLTLEVLQPKDNNMLIVPTRQSDKH
jgi:iron complex transport system ATP-binding protein